MGLTDGAGFPEVAARMIAQAPCLRRILDQK